VRAAGIAAGDSVLEGLARRGALTPECADEAEVSYYSITGEELDDRRRARMLDEALEILRAAWSGEPVHHRGEHYTVDGMRFLPRPVQRPGVRAKRADYRIRTASPLSCVELIHELRLDASEPGRSPREVVRALAGRDQEEPAGRRLGERQDALVEVALELLGANS
jgi:alkanesulfonate monooxygenase SsuD/methylene tetrahydromethanopterin reductase-like flavin-dependent oxidoreductase (luciferase family)